MYSGIEFHREERTSSARMQSVNWSHAMAFVGSSEGGWIAC